MGFGLTFENSTKNGQYQSYLDTKQRVYRIYKEGDNDLSIPRQPFKEAFAQNTSTGIREQSSLSGNFSKYVNAIYRYFNVEQKNEFFWRYENTKVSQPFYSGNHDYGFNCMKYGTRCMAD